MCPQAGQPLLSASDVLPRGGLLAIGSMNAQAASQPSSNSPTAASNPCSTSPPSVGSPQPTSNESGERNDHARPSLTRALLAALFLPILASCSWVKPWPRDPAPAVTPCPIVQCLDRALKTCDGVTPPADGVRSCQDAVLLASDALGEVLVCQQAHAELIRCVEDFNRAKER